MDLTPFHGPPATAPRVPGFVARTLLGFGTHGEVWLADDLSTGGTVALKIGRRAPEDPAAASGDPPGARPEQETALLCRIDHPHIVRLQRVVPLPDGGLAMVLDLASGGSLASLVAARGRFDPGEVSTLLVPLADALDHLHRRGVVHGDIAPGNVLFTGDGRPQLGDLGAARVLGTRTGDAWATPGFTDPALTRADADGIDLRAADLWGLAAIGWFALTGRPPEPAAVGGAAADRAPVLGELLSQCLSADPVDRPSLHELADRAWQAARPIPVRLVTGRDLDLDDVGLPPLSNRVTRRVPVMGADALPNGSLLPGSLPGDPSGAALPGSAPPGADPPTDPSTGRLAALTLGPLAPRPKRPESRAGRLEAGSASGAAVGLAGAWERIGVTRKRGAGRDGVRNLGVRPDDRGSGREQGRGARFRGPLARGRGSTVVALLSVATAVAAVGLTVTLKSADSAGISATSATGASPASGSASATPVGGTTSPAPVASARLEAELARALNAIGRSRSAAFGRASARYLADADVAGSPAYQEDLRLVQRLRAQGYRLQGVRYRVSQVQVLHQRGELVDVRAVVTTSEHRQVRLSSGVGVPVPADGPRPVVLTVAPIDLNVSGPTRWRVRSVQVPS